MRRDHIYSALSGLLQLLERLLRAWPFVLIGLHLLLPFGVHMRWEYSFVGSYSNKIYTRCDYIGSRGILEDVRHLTPDCPFFVILDSREFR
ncbi:MAG: hypothetical protein AAFQ24_13045 [Pseudomonadota bacterium]